MKIKASQLRAYLDTVSDDAEIVAEIQTGEEKTTTLEFSDSLYGPGEDCPEENAICVVIDGDDEKVYLGFKPLV
jgi:hypothetical protein